MHNPYQRTFPLVKQDGQLYRVAYDLLFPDISDVAIELECARMKHSPENGGLGEREHFKNVCCHIYPEMRETWEYWLDRRLDGFLSDTIVTTFLSGGGIGKSFAMGLFGYVWWQMNPTERGVLVGTTTLSAIEGRVFGYIKAAHRRIEKLGGFATGGNYPKIIVKHENEYGEIEEDKQHGIFAKAIKSSSPAAAVEDLIGYHPKDGLLILIDEAADIYYEAIRDAIPNWIKGTRMLKVVMSGNPRHPSDTLCKFSEPDHPDRWGTIKWGETVYWKTVWGEAYHFDCYDSPRIKEPERLEDCVWLPTEETIERDIRLCGGEDTEIFLRQNRGIYVFDNSEDVAITYSMCNKHKVKSRPDISGFGHQYMLALDPSFSTKGDECIFKIFQRTLDKDGRYILDFMGDETTFSLALKASKVNPHSYQILDKLIDLCEEWNIPPEYCIIDTMGSGIGLGDLLKVEFSTSFIEASVVGRASDRFIDINQKKKASELYANKATELWFAVQQFIQSDQIFGLDDKTIDQLCTRTYEIRNGKYYIQQKKKFKALYGYSPDRADAVSYGVELARQHGLKQKIIHRKEEMRTEFEAVRNPSKIFKSKAPRATFGLPSNEPEPPPHPIADLVGKLVGD